MTMPLYEYECAQCKRHTEKIQKFSDAEITICPHCGGPLVRVISAAAISFKGGGWFKDGYGNAKPSPSAGESKSDSGTSAGSSGEGGSSSGKEASSGNEGSSGKDGSSSKSGKESAAASSDGPASTTASAPAPPSSSSSDKK